MNAEIAGPLITAAGAIVVALIAAWPLLKRTRDKVIDSIQAESVLNSTQHQVLSEKVSNHNDRVMEKFDDVHHRIDRIENKFDHHASEEHQRDQEFGRSLGQIEGKLNGLIDRE